MSPQKALAALAALAREKPPEPFTLRRLRTIKPGQEVIYFSGDIDDIKRSGPVYRELVERIADYARGLELAGRVDLIERPRLIKGERGRTLTVTDYVAAGKLRRL